MSQERFDHQEKMLEQLIHMVGHNNTITEELCQRMGRLETKVDNLEAKVNSLETKVDNLKAKVNSLEIKVDNLEAKVNSLEIKVDSGFEGLTGMVHLLGDKTEAIPRIESKLDVLNSRLFEQEAEINLLKRAK
jgi:chromosome segregation ATPase